MSITTVELTASEKEMLNAIIIGYGKLRKAAGKSGVPEQTLRRISLVGIGYEKYVTAIRETLLEPAKVEQATA